MHLSSQPYTLQCIALQCSALQCSAVQCSAMQCIAVQCSAVQWSALHCTAIHCIPKHCSALHCTALYCTNWHWATHPCTEPQYCVACISLYSSALNNIELSSTALHYTVQYCIRQGCTVLCSAALNWFRRRDTVTSADKSRTAADTIQYNIVLDSVYSAVKYIEVQCILQHDCSAV